MVSLGDLDPDQQVAASAPRGPVCILAGAGTGKTRTITYRIAHLIERGFFNPNRVLAVTFTTRAAQEMRVRLESMGIGGVHARTFHSAAYRQLSYFWRQVAGDMEWGIVEKKFSYAAQAMKKAGLPQNRERVRDILHEIEWAKASLITPEKYPEIVSQIQRDIPAEAEQISSVYRLYEELKCSPSRMLLDYDDLILYMAAAIENNPAVAAEFRSQYRSFVVDEYQDVTPLQQRLLDAWLGDRDDLTVVGDANQTIYSFNGATPRYLLDFSRKYPHATVVKLQRDYRSTPQIVKLANTVISHARGRVAGTRLELQGMRAHGPQPQFREYDDEPAEARDIAKHIRALLASGTPAQDIAILYRINAQSESYERALSEAGIPYHVHGGEGFFQRPEIKEALRALVRASQSGDLPEELHGVGLAQLVREILAPLGYSSVEPEGSESRDRWYSLKALVELTEELGQTIPDLDLVGLLLRLKERQQSQLPPTMEEITLASMHAAKGLEWDVVFLAGLSDNMLPFHYVHNKGIEKIEEERRLFYVGITRAREVLNCSWALARQEGGRKNRKRSRFFDDLFPEVEQRTIPPRSGRSHCCRECGKKLSTPQERVLGRCLHCPSNAQPGVFAALRQWRSDIARENKIPAYIVFTDATLLAIAESMPKTPADLLDISGIGPVKVENYGADLLRILADFRD
ncbi:AAA family ATPase [Corynebacterium poyangense]|uniref:DNA 3'-5' helicase n=1 Tax=Corynebacterium poyangense TaxID=2684405 RepID=A0A7H0SMM4_9CORY|nr:ATP-dependent DNA helicase UvrD2 [Corynebacterium poyangense]QNQ89799.1 AAA family ATPase [Corynebacterium poyangense]